MHQIRIKNTSGAEILVYVRIDHLLNRLEALSRIGLAANHKQILFRIIYSVDITTKIEFRISDTLQFVS